MKQLLIALTAVLIASGTSQAALHLKSAAKKIAQAADRNGIARLAVGDLEPMDGSSINEGRHIAGQLSTYLNRYAQSRIIERAQLEQVLREQRFGLTGAVSADKAVRTGALLQAEAVVTGTYISNGNDTEIHLKLINVETGALIDARRATLKRAGLGQTSRLFQPSSDIDAEDAVADVYYEQTGYYYPKARPVSRRRPAAPQLVPISAASMEAEDLRDSPANFNPCEGARELVDDMQASILDLKARYWARKALDKGFSISDVAYRPATTISDAGLRQEFFERMREAWESGTSGLDAEEARRFIAVDRKSFELRQECSL